MQLPPTIGMERLTSGLQLRAFLLRGASAKMCPGLPLSSVLLSLVYISYFLGRLLSGVHPSIGLQKAFPGSSYTVVSRSVAFSKYRPVAAKQLPSAPWRPKCVQIKKEAKLDFLALPFETVFGTFIKEILKSTLGFCLFLRPSPERYFIDVWKMLGVCVCVCFSRIVVVGGKCWKQ